MRLSTLSVRHDYLLLAFSCEAFLMQIKHGFVSITDNYENLPTHSQEDSDMIPDIYSSPIDYLPAGNEVQCC